MRWMSRGWHQLQGAGILFQGKGKYCKFQNEGQKDADSNSQK